MSGATRLAARSHLRLARGAPSREARSANAVRSVARGPQPPSGLSISAAGQDSGSSCWDQLLATIDRSYDEVTGQAEALSNTVRLATFSSVAVQVLLEILSVRNDAELFGFLDAGDAEELGFAVLTVPAKYLVDELV